MRTRTRTTVLVLTTVMSFALVMAAVPAGAAKPDCKPHQPNCSTTTEPPLVQSCATLTTLSGTGSLGFECDWTPRNNGATTGTVTVTVISGEVSRVVLFVRDSSPGDICVLEQWWKATGTVFEASFPLADGPETYWNQGGTNWCEPFDPVAGQRTDLNGDPLHVRVNVRAKKGTVVEVTLSPGAE
jgi:hypothetical protein